MLEDPSVDSLNRQGFPESEVRIARNRYARRMRSGRGSFCEDSSFVVGGGGTAEERPTQDKTWRFPVRCPAEAGAVKGNRSARIMPLTAAEHIVFNTRLQNTAAFIQRFQNTFFSSFVTLEAVSSRNFANKGRQTHRRCSLEGDGVANEWPTQDKTPKSKVPKNFDGVPQE